MQTSRNFGWFAALWTLVLCAVGVLSARYIDTRPPRLEVASAEVQAKRLDVFARCVESASRSGPATFAPGDVVRACRDAAVELVAAEQMGPPEAEDIRGAKAR